MKIIILYKRGEKKEAENLRENIDACVKGHAISIIQELTEG